MTTNASDVHTGDPEAQLEETLIEEFLRALGFDSKTVHALPEDAERRVLTAASLYADDKLAEIEARAHFLHKIHDPR